MRIRKKTSESARIFKGVKGMKCKGFESFDAKCLHLPTITQEIFWSINDRRAQTRTKMMLKSAYADFLIAIFF